MTRFARNARTANAIQESILGRGVMENKVDRKRKLEEEDLLSAVQNRIALQKARR